MSRNSGGEAEVYQAAKAELQFARRLAAGPYARDIPRRHYWVAGVVGEKEVRIKRMLSRSLT